VVIRFRRPNASCVQGAAGRVTAPDTAALELRRTTCTDGFGRDGGPVCTLRFAAPRRLVMVCGQGGSRTVLSRVR
jgi:hypothetical protein